MPNSPVKLITSMNTTHVNERARFATVFILAIVAVGSPALGILLHGVKELAVERMNLHKIGRFTK